MNFYTLKKNRKIEVKMETKLSKPGIVCLVGTISSGKTTVKDKVIIPEFSESIRVNSIDEPIEEWMEQGIWKKYCTNTQKYAFLFELNTLTDRAGYSRDIYLKEKDKTDLFIMERDLLSSKIFYNLSVEDGLVSVDQQMVYQKIYKYCLDSSVFLPDLYVYLRSDLDLVLSRQRERNRTDEKIDSDYQKRLISFHDDVFNRDYITIKNKKIPVLVLDKPIDLADKRSKKELIRLIRIMLLNKNKI